MSSAKILVILEGEQPEGNTLARLQRAFPDELADFSEDLVKIVYTSNIYALYNALKEDNEFLDVVEVLKERFPSNIHCKIFREMRSHRFFSSLIWIFTARLWKIPASNFLNCLSSLITKLKTESCS